MEADIRRYGVPYPCRLGRPQRYEKWRGTPGMLSTPAEKRYELGVRHPSDIRYVRDEVDCFHSNDELGGRNDDAGRCKACRLFSYKYFRE